MRASFSASMSPLRTARGRIFRGSFGRAVSRGCLPSPKTLSTMSITSLCAAFCKANAFSPPDEASQPEKLCRTARRRLQNLTETPRVWRTACGIGKISSSPESGKTEEPRDTGRQRACINGCERAGKLTLRESPQPGRTKRERSTNNRRPPQNFFTSLPQLINRVGSADFHSRSMRFRRSISSSSMPSRPASSSILRTACKTVV